MLRVFTGGKQGEKQAIDQLIEERLMLQEAKRRNVDVTDAELDAEIDNRARSAKLTGPQFMQALRQAGVDSEDLQGVSARQPRVAGGRAGALSRNHRGYRTGRHCRADWHAPRTPCREEQTVFEYRLQPIIFIVPAGAGAGAEATRRSEANAFRRPFRVAIRA